MILILYGIYYGKTIIISHKFKKDYENSKQEI